MVILRTRTIGTSETVEQNCYEIRQLHLPFIRFPLGNGRSSFASLKKKGLLCQFRLLTAELHEKLFSSPC
jgi:hypothetical protein